MSCTILCTFQPQIIHKVHDVGMYYSRWLFMSCDDVCFNAADYSWAAHCCIFYSESQLILIETLQQENAKFAESQALEEVTRTVSRMLQAFCHFCCKLLK